MRVCGIPLGVGVEIVGWENPTASNIYWSISTDRKEYTAPTTTRVAAIIRKPKTSGKWFFAFNLTNSNTESKFAGLCKESVINTESRGTTGGILTGEYVLGMVSGNVKYRVGSGSNITPSPVWYLITTGNTTPGIGGDLAGVGYDASTGEITAWKFDVYGTNAWVQKQSITTVTPGESLVPFFVNQAAMTAPVVYRADVTPPSGYTIWA